MRGEVEESGRKCHLVTLLFVPKCTHQAWIPTSQNLEPGPNVSLHCAFSSNSLPGGAWVMS